MRDNRISLKMITKKNKQIQNKTIPSPLRPKFRNRNETNIYFLSKNQLNKKKLIKIIVLAAVGVVVVSTGLIFFLL